MFITYGKQRATLRFVYPVMCFWHMYSSAVSGRRSAADQLLILRPLPMTQEYPMSKYFSIIRFEALVLT